MNNKFLSWNDSIVLEASREFVTLMPGTYTAEVTKIEKTRCEWAGEMNGCPMAKVYLSVTDRDGRKASLTDNILLAEDWIWKISNFLISAGVAKAGDGLELHKFADTEHKKLMVNVVCKYKDANDKYTELNKDQAQAVLADGGKVYNNVSGYEPVKEAPKVSGGFNPAAFGYKK